MLQLAIGNIETVGMLAAIEAADVACKTANVSLIGYQLSRGGGMVTVKIEGQVSAVQAAVQAAKNAANLVSKVYAVSVIPRPDSGLACLIKNTETIGYQTELKVEQKLLAENPIKPAENKTEVAPQAPPIPAENKTSGVNKNSSRKARPKGVTKTQPSNKSAVIPQPSLERSEE